ncbi:MAG: polysaccharide biosynthesis protein [Clostridiales bacterium]|nr:polysaccharide biosynthesis protein [Clostridiales bacterium]
MPKNKKQNVLDGALILVAATVIIKVIGAIYKIPLTSLIGTEGRGYFASAYNIYTPLYAISMAGLPVAVSRLVSENMTLGNYRDVRMIFRIALRLFVITGTVGTVLLLLLSYPYTYLDWSLSIHSPQTMPSIIMIAPSIFFCCIMSAYRGYYEGMRNMLPTALSQVIEAIGKLIIGLSCAKLVMVTGLKQFESGGVVFGKSVASLAEAYSVIYPYTAAAAIAGVTFGTVAGTVYLVIRHKRCGGAITRTQLVNSRKPLDSTAIARSLVAVAVPILLSTLVSNITNFIDAWTVQNRLAYVVANNLDAIKSIYAGPLTAAQVLDGNIKTFLYGALDTTSDFKNLIPTITMTLGVSAIPVLSGAWALKDKAVIKKTVESVVRVTMLLAMPAGFGMAALAEPILSLLYNGTNNANAVSIAAPIMAFYGLFMMLMSVSAPLVNMLQAIGRADVPLKAMLVACTAKTIVNIIFVGIVKVNIWGAPLGTFAFYLVAVTHNTFFLLKETKIRPNIKSVLFKPLLCGGVCGLSAYFSYKLLCAIVPAGNALSRINGSTVSALISVCVAVAVYAFLLLITKSISRDDVLMLPKGEKIAKTLEKYRLLG